MSHRAALARMMLKTPPDRLAWRALYRAKRRVRLGLASVGFSTPLAHGTRAQPLPLDRWPRRRVPQQHPVLSPNTLHLHGYDLPLGPDLPWTPQTGFSGTDLQLVHLHEHRWCAALPDPRFIEILSSWIDQVRPYEPRYWIASWNGYTLASRVVTWMRELPTRELPEGFRVKVQASLLEQLGFLYRNLELDVRGNHLLRDLMALGWGAACFHGPDAERWLGVVLQRLPAELDHQIHSDGLHFEGSPAYHLQVFADLLQLWQALPDGEVRVRLLEALNRMATAIVLTTHPDGRPSLFSDGGLHTASPPAALLHAYTNLTGQEIPAAPLTALIGGQSLAVHRSPDQLLLVDCGPVAPDDLPAHGHADVFSFEWSVGGRRVIIDTGVYAYQKGPIRAYARGTVAHNTLTLDDHDQAEMFDAFRIGRRPQVRRTTWAPRGDGFVLAGQHDGFAHLEGSPRHRRRFDLRGLRLFVEDHVDGGRGQQAVARLLLHPDVVVHPTPTGATLILDTHRITLRTTATLRVRVAPWWPDFGTEQTTRQIELDYGQAPCRGGFTLTVQEPAPDPAHSPPLE
ncbi:MAG: hypothetical protein EA397_06945 [Deltaproteobacteria bacterium]|nr:MAG: hypothetical protein EA397_06945 [Deltaproteobacteria bacterium]